MWSGGFAVQLCITVTLSRSRRDYKLATAARPIHLFVTDGAK